MGGIEMRLWLNDRKEFIASPRSTKGRPRALALQRVFQPPLRRATSAAGKAALLFLVLSALSFWAQLASAQSTTNNEVTINGNNYPYTAAGIQAAINAASNIANTTGTGGVVILPAATINLGSTGLTLPSSVCLLGASSDSSWLGYTGTGSAITFPVGTTQACLKHITVNLNGAGLNAIGINLRGNFEAGYPDVFDKVEDVTVTAGAVEAGQIGINLVDLSSASQPYPSGVQLSWFDNILISNLGQPIVITGQEGNFWKDIHINGFSSVAVNSAFASDNFWQLRVTGPSVSSSGIAFQEAGRMNHISVVCDFGQGARTCVNDTGGRNMWDVSALTPVGTVAADSFFQETAGFGHGIAPVFQVSSAAATGLSPTINSPAPSCLEMGNSNGSGGENYVTFLNGTMSVTTTPPSSCP
jgi:hypothetical protein